MRCFLQHSKTLAFAVPLLITLGWLCQTRFAAPIHAGSSAESPADEYAKTIRPLLQKYCYRCHGSKREEGDINLETYQTSHDLRPALKVWEKIHEMIAGEQMPPAKAEQWKPAERLQVLAWLRGFLKEEAKRQAGDPGPVVLRRLSNAEYTYTLRDLTGLPSLAPARQFPADAAAGEGFSNTGQALVMSSALIDKYLEAAKEVDGHAVFLPDGIEFFESTTRRDWTNELLQRIRQYYGRYSASRGGTRVNLQGIVFDTNAGGGLPLEDYLVATISEREPLEQGKKSLETVARERGLSSKYLTKLWCMLHDKTPSYLLAEVQSSWQNATAKEVRSLAQQIERWQQALVRFQSVGHMKPWMVAVDPVETRQDFRVPVGADASQTLNLYLQADAAQPQRPHSVVIWERPRFVIPGQAELLLRDILPITEQMAEGRAAFVAMTAKCLQAAAEAADGPSELAELARKHEVDPVMLGIWLEKLGIGPSTPQLKYFTKQLKKVGGHEFVEGWGDPNTPSLVANSSATHVRIPGNMPGRHVCVHPSPELKAAVGWKSPVAGQVSIAGTVLHAHPECGHGVTWFVEVRRGGTRQQLASGSAEGSKPISVGPFTVSLKKGDLVCLLVGPRQGTHACGLTDINLTIQEAGGEKRIWSLAPDVSPHVLAANPHPDGFGNADTWHFYTEPVRDNGGEESFPKDSLLARWLSAAHVADKSALAAELAKLLSGPPAAEAGKPDILLYRQLMGIRGPLFAWARKRVSQQNTERRFANASVGINPELFGKAPGGTTMDAASLAVQTPSMLAIPLPRDLLAGAELIVSGRVDKKLSPQGSVQLHVGIVKPDQRVHAPAVDATAPIVVADENQVREQWRTAFADFRQLFPPALCYTKIVPVDEVVTLTLFHREDEPYQRLMLNATEQAELNRLWEQLHFVSQDALTLVAAYKQLMEFATQDGDPKQFEPYRKPIMERAEEYRREVLAAEPRQVDAVLAWASRAYRRPLTPDEIAQLRTFYEKVKVQKSSHEEALRLTLARILVAPAFLYRLEATPAGVKTAAVSNAELATRLSYFLWSSMPDQELREKVEAGKLQEGDLLAQQADRMLKDAKVRRLATEFVCQWLHIYAFDTLDEKSERHFPTFTALRQDMYEEAIRFFTDLFQNDRSVLSIFDGQHAFVNEALAKHYGIPNIQGPDWRRIDDARRYGRGGILGLAATLAKESGASRTSPILRGNWVCEVLLGEKLPKPPKDVPKLPDDEADLHDLTVRQLIEKHSSDPRCAVCHVRIDAFGFALEGYDAIGGRRQKDSNGHTIDTHARLRDGTEIDGMDGLRNYLLTKRRADVIRQFSRKLLGYGLGRAVQLSDEPLLDEIAANLAKNDYRFSSAVLTIVRSQQFREIRGSEWKE